MFYCINFQWNIYNTTRTPIKTLKNISRTLCQWSYWKISFSSFLLQKFLFYYNNCFITLTMFICNTRTSLIVGTPGGFEIQAKISKRRVEGWKISGLKGEGFSWKRRVQISRGGAWIPGHNIPFISNFIFSFSQQMTFWFCLCFLRSKWGIWYIALMSLPLSLHSILFSSIHSVIFIKFGCLPFFVYLYSIFSIDNIVPCNWNMYSFWLLVFLLKLLMLQSLKFK